MRNPELRARCQHHGTKRHRRGCAQRITGRVGFTVIRTTRLRHTFGSTLPGGSFEPSSDPTLRSCDGPFVSEWPQRFAPTGEGAFGRCARHLANSRNIPGVVCW